MKKYIDFKTEKRMNAANDFVKDFFKLIINSVYGKTMEIYKKESMCDWQIMQKTFKIH